MNIGGTLFTRDSHFEEIDFVDLFSSWRSWDLPPHLFY
jgi:hypothetical protein